MEFPFSELFCAVNYLDNKYVPAVLYLLYSVCLMPVLTRLSGGRAQPDVLQDFHLFLQIIHFRLSLLHPEHRRRRRHSEYPLP